MMTILLYGAIAYLLVCWLWGMYVAIRLYSGRRVSRLLQGAGIKERRKRGVPASAASGYASSVAEGPEDQLAESRAA